MHRYDASRCERSHLLEPIALATEPFLSAGDAATEPFRSPGDTATDPLRSAEAGPEPGGVRLDRFSRAPSKLTGTTRACNDMSPRSVTTFDDAA